MTPEQVRILLAYQRAILLALCNGNDTKADDYVSAAMREIPEVSA